MLSLAGGLPAPSTFPVDQLGAAFERAMRRAGPTGPVALQYAPTEGLSSLRELVAARAGMAVDETLVTTGSQQGLDLLARVLVDPGDLVVVEEPSYLGALQAFRLAGAALRGIAGDRHGLDVAELAARLESGWRPKAVYVVSNFHNPTGATLSADRRSMLLELAGRYGFVVIEDDPYGELRFGGAALAPIGGPGRPVVRLGSASKVLAPGLRVGWMTGPRPVVQAATLTKQAVDLHTPSLNQLLVGEVLQDAGHPAHLAATRETYRRRAHALSSSLRHHLGGRLSFADAEGGMFLWAQLVPGLDAERVLDAALDEGVAFVPGSAFAVDGPRHHDRLRLSFATLDAGQLDEAGHRLALAVQRCLGADHRSRHPERVVPAAR